MIRFALLAALPLAACAASPHPGDAKKCDAARIGDIVGQELTATLQSKSQSRAHARTVRVIAPGMMGTMDYRIDRLNIHVDDENRVTRADCG